MSLVNKPEEFKGVVDFPLPAKSLEGYLYPDTYDLPPLLGAKATITRQLKAFQKKIWDAYHHPSNLHELVIKGSLVQLEAGRDDERPIIAGVIENRLKKGMRLQIDAALLYGIQKWRRLTFDDYKNLDSPYNLYRVSGLPPGPICSPSAKSFAAAKNPATHGNFYYVALPDGSSLFARTYDEHLQNIQNRKHALKLVGASYWIGRVGLLKSTGSRGSSTRSPRRTRSMSCARSTSIFLGHAVSDSCFSTSTTP
jgi:UPF0755 protein